MVHWSIAVPFMVCYATAVILFVFYYANPDRPHRDVFSWIHRLSGVCLFVFPTLILVRNRQDFRVHLDNVRQAWLWTLSDIKWLFLMGLAAVSSRFQLPEQGKFNAAEKLNFMMVMGTWPLYIVTGVLIWMPGVAFVAWVLHVAMAVAATPLMLGHIFMATINPETRVGLSGMISGFVDRQWAEHHYRRWYREQFEGPGDVSARTSGPSGAKARLPEAVPGARPRVPVPRDRPNTPAAAAPPYAPARSDRPLAPASADGSSGVLVQCPACRWEHRVASWDSLLRSVFTAEAISCSHCRVTFDVLSVIGEPHDVEWILAELDAATRRAIERDGQSAVVLSPVAPSGEAAPGRRPPRLPRS